MQPHLSARDLGKQFVLHILHEKRVLGFEGISFDVMPGTFVGIAGRSGSGKSSLLKALYRTYLVDSGTIEYRSASGETIELVTASDDDILDLRAREIGYVSQFLRPTPRVPALELAARPLRRRGASREDAYARVSEYFARLQLPRELWDGHPVLFSGGEQQRVNLARALAAQPRLLLLDEPTSALDSTLQSEVVQLLIEARERGTTMVGIMHDTTLLNAIADTVFTMESGHIVHHATSQMPAVAVSA